jgi:hypothetical protein
MLEDSPDRHQRPGRASDIAVLFSGSDARRCDLGDRPDESDKLSSDGCDDDGSLFPASEHSAIPSAEPDLRHQGDASGGRSGTRRELIITLAARHRLPATYPYPYHVATGVSPLMALMLSTCTGTGHSGSETKEAQGSKPPTLRLLQSNRERRQEDRLCRKRPVEALALPARRQRPVPDH